LWHLILKYPSSFIEKARVRQLKKRLLWLLEPLVLSLGDNGDNLSFLLRMSELIGKNFHPVLASEEYNSTDTSKRLEVVCRAARDVLLKFVKKDVDLSSYSGPVSDLCLLFTKRKHIWLFLHFYFFPGHIKIQIPATLFTKKTDISSHDVKSKHLHERGFVSFADEVESKMISDYKEHGQSNDFAESLEHTSHGKEFLQKSATAKKIKNAFPSAPLLSEKEQSLKSAEKSDSSSLDKASNSKEASTVNVDTPSQDGIWGMSPIAPSASPHNADFLFSSSTGDTSLISGNSGGDSAGVAGSPFEAELNVFPTIGLTTPHGQPSLTPILRTSVPRQSSSSSKKLSVSFSSKDASFDGGQSSGKFLSNTPLSEVSHKTGLKNQVQKRQRAATKKQVLMKNASASSASSKVTASSNSSGSSRRSRSSASKSPLEVEENNLDFQDFDDSENLVPPLKRKAVNRVKAKYDEDSVSPVKRTKTTKKAVKKNNVAVSAAGNKVKDRNSAPSSDRRSSDKKSGSKSQNKKKKIRVSKQL
jgi:hypothetical protein